MCGSLLAGKEKQMPTPFLKKVAKEHEISISAVEGIWGKAKKITKKFLRVSSPMFWGTVTNIFKAHLHAKLKKIKKD